IWATASRRDSPRDRERNRNATEGVPYRRFCRERPPWRSGSSAARAHESHRVARGADQRRPWVEADGDRQTLHQSVESSLIAERFEERALLHRRQDLRRDAAAHEDAAERQALQRQVARLRAVQRAE